MSSHNPFRPFPARRNPTVGGADAASTTARAATPRRDPHPTSPEPLNAAETAESPIVGVPPPNTAATHTAAYTRDELEALDRDDLVAVAADHGLDTYRVKSTVLVDQLLTISG